MALVDRWSLLSMVRCPYCPSSNTTTTTNGSYYNYYCRLFRFQTTKRAAASTSTSLPVLPVFARLTAGTSSTARNPHGAAARAAALPPAPAPVVDATFRSTGGSTGIVWGRGRRWIHTNNTASENGVARLGLGSTKWNQLVDNSSNNNDNNSNNVYSDIVATALEQGITTIEAGLEGGDVALVEAYRRFRAAQSVSSPPSISSSSSSPSSPLEILVRIGYRQQSPEACIATPPLFPNDVLVSSATPPESSSNNSSVWHNLSPEYIRHVVTTSPLVALQRDFPQSIRLVFLLHNPEVQIAAAAAAAATSFSSSSSSSTTTTLSTSQGQPSLESILTKAFVALQELCQPPLHQQLLVDNDGDNDDDDATRTVNRPDQPTTMQTTVVAPWIHGFGITSNGLSLPWHHPLHLSWGTVEAAAVQAAAEVQSRTSSSSSSSNGHSLAFRIVQLPLNALETNGGLTVARHIQRLKHNLGAAGDTTTTTSLWSHVSVHGLRPLTCYPNGGVTTNTLATTTAIHPFVLADFKVSADGSHTDSLNGTVWTNQLGHCPTIYDVAFRQALSHLDASDLLETKAMDELTPEERETLQGCRLLQDLLYEVDAHLVRTRSWSAHQDYLARHVIPTLYGTFDAYDDDTAQILAAYFGAVSIAARYYVAANTRHLLCYGEDDKLTGTSDSKTHVESIAAAATTAVASTTKAPIFSATVLPQSKRLQEFGLEFVLSQTVDVKSPTVAPTASDDLDSAPKKSVDDVDDSRLVFAIDKIIVGSSHPHQVLDTVDIVRRFRGSLE